MTNKFSTNAPDALFPGKSLAYSLEGKPVEPRKKSGWEAKILFLCRESKTYYRGADKSLAPPTSRYNLFDD
jgi:hypothetical protein